MGVFDEGCMGMFNAIVPDHLLNATGVYKERLSQSSLYAAMREVSTEEAQGVRAWLDRKGLVFKTGPNPETDLTDAQILTSAECILRQRVLPPISAAMRSEFSINRA